MSSLKKIIPAGSLAGERRIPQRASPRWLYSTGATCRHLQRICNRPLPWRSAVCYLGTRVDRITCSGSRRRGEVSAQPVRVQLSRKKGWRMPENTVKVDRTNRMFGNIFKVGSNPSHFSTALPSHCDTPEEAVRCFRYFAATWMAITHGKWIDPLVGKNLACWCALDQPCHADVLLELANTPDQGPTP